MKNRGNCGITLVALIITIIVLIILGGIAISMIINGGIFGYAGKAGFLTEMKAYQEQTSLYVAGYALSMADTSEEAGYWIIAKDINAGSENLLKWGYTDEGLDIENEINLEDILDEPKKQYKDQIIIYKGELYYIYNRKKSDQEKVRWCLESNIKVWEFEGTLEDLDEWLSEMGEEEDRYPHNGDYILVHEGTESAMYMCIPDLTGFEQMHTRYVSWGNEGNGNQEVGTWTVKNPVSNWYDYKKQNWANVLVETNGKEAYFVWIPRYVYKLDSVNQQTEVKFVDKSNNFKGVSEPDINWEGTGGLKEQGYQIPESFAWGDNEEDMSKNTQLAGYWMSKYEVNDVSIFLLDATMVAGERYIEIKDITFPDTLLNASHIAKYEYYINANKKAEQITNGEAPTQKITIDKLVPGRKYTVNITALDSGGNVKASLTRDVKTSKTNKPVLAGFNPNTTFYVTWEGENKNGVEHNEIPITQNPPSDWYNYAKKEWANIVTRNNGKEAYYVWIPRYEYKVINADNPNVQLRYADVVFIGSDKIIPDEGYQIPEAFSFGDDPDWTKNMQLEGYWFSKYEVSPPISPILDADIGVRDTSVKVSKIRGTGVTGDIKYEFYINGARKDNGNNTTGEYTYTDLKKDTKYTINVIARKADGSNEYIGAVTREIITVGANAPDTSGFNKATTFYVEYNSNGDEVATNRPLTESPPENWYDYADKKWANVVCKNNGKEAYFVWIPRYSYKTLYNDVNANTAYAEIDWIRGTGTEPRTGFSIPESFSWGDNTDWKENTQLTGYWMSKYEVSQ